jgi:hypothetical protein
MKINNVINQLVVLLPWVVVLLVVFIAVVPLVPPSLPSNLESSDFSVVLAFDHINSIAQEPRPMGSPASKRTQAYIITHLQMLGLEPEVQITEAPNYYTSTDEIVEIVNIIVLIPGMNSTTAVALVGHYDTIPASLGANDDASAVAIMLETARAIIDGPRLQNDVILIFTDGEEPAPRFGSSAFIRDHPWAANIGFVINLETIGSGGSSTLIEMNGPGKWIINQYAKGVPYPLVFSYLTTVSELIGGSNTDFSEFRDVGIPGVGLAYLHGSPIYHTLSDNPDQVSLRSLQQQGANTLSLTRQIGSFEFGPTLNDVNAVFFTIGRYYVVQYSVAWALPLVLLVGVLLIFVVMQKYKSGVRILVSTSIILITLVIVAMITVGVWTLLAGWRDTMGIFESYLYLASLLALTAGIVIVMARLTKRKIGSQPDAIGVVIIWWVFGLLTTITAPGISYIFVWPSLAGSLTLLIKSSQATEHLKQIVGFVLVVSTALVLVVPAIDFFYQFAQPRPGNLDSQILFVIAIPVMLFTMVFELIRAFWVRRMN